MSPGLLSGLFWERVGGTAGWEKGCPSAEGMDRKVHLHASLLIFPAWFCHFLL